MCGLVCMLPHRAVAVLVIFNLSKRRDAQPFVEHVKKKFSVFLAELACGDGAPRNEKDAKAKHRRERGQNPRRVRREHQQRDGAPAEPAQAS